MYIGRDFDPAQVGESEVYSLDFANDMNTNDVISTVSFTLDVESGTDATPSARLDGLPSHFGKIAMQRLSGLVLGVVYIITATIVTTQGNTLSLWSRVRCLPV